MRPRREGRGEGWRKKGREGGRKGAESIQGRCSDRGKEWVLGGRGEKRERERMRRPESI